MNKTQYNKIGSHQVRLEFLQKATETRGIVPLTGKLLVYAKKLETTTTLADIQGGNARAAIVLRNVAMKAMIDAGVVVAALVMSYAAENEMVDLIEETRLQEGDFTRVRLQQRIRLAQRLHDVVLPLLPALVDYGVTAETLTDLQKKIDAAGKSLPAKRGSVADRKAATAQLVVAVRELDAIEATQIHPLLKPFEISNPEFYQRYEARRQVLDLPGTRSKENTGTPVPPDGGTPVEPANSAPAVQKAA